MEIFIYTQINNQNKDALLKEVSQVSTLAPVMFFDFGNLFNMVRSKISGHVIIIFLLSEAEELESLISNRTKLFNSQFILILPENADNLVSKALSLYPRYLANEDYGFTDVSAVLNKMLQNHAQKEKSLLL